MQELEPRQAEALVRAKGPVESLGHVGLGGDGEGAQSAPEGVDGGVHAAVILFDPSVEPAELVGWEPSHLSRHDFGGFLGEGLDRRRDAREGAVAQGDPAFLRIGTIDRLDDLERRDAVLAGDRRRGFLAAANAGTGWGPAQAMMSGIR